VDEKNNLLASEDNPDNPLVRGHALNNPYNFSLATKALKHKGSQRFFAN